MKSFITQLKPFAFLTGISAGKVEKHPKNSKKATDTSSILVERPHNNSPIRTLVEKIDYCSYSLQYWLEALLLKYDHCFGASRKQKSKKFRSIIKNILKCPDNLNLFSTYVSGLWLRCYIVFDMP